jgi:hypothetical protein
MVENGSIEAILALMEQGNLEMEGLVPWGSNYTFLVQVRHGEDQINAIYKPSRGERPLWDFAHGSLGQRERAAFLISESLGWHLVPPTILRDGPHGWGSVQYFIPHDPEQHYLTLKDQFVVQVQRIAIFDVLINNADRKSGHVLLGDDGRLWAIDHGVSFHADYKLRSVIWDFAGDPISGDDVADLVTFREWLRQSGDMARRELDRLISKSEVKALERRLERLIDEGVFPQPGPGRPYPWPLV